MRLQKLSITLFFSFSMLGLVGIPSIGAQIADEPRIQENLYKFDSGFYEKIVSLRSGPSGQSDEPRYYSVVLATTNKTALIDDLILNYNATNIFNPKVLTTVITAEIPIDRIPSLVLNHNVAKIGDGLAKLESTATSYNQNNSTHQSIKDAKIFHSLTSEIPQTGNGITIGMLDMHKTFSHVDLPSSTVIEIIGCNEHICSDVIIPGVNHDTHFNHAASILAGSGSSNSDMRGFAPNADIIFAPVGRENQRIVALDYMLEKNVDLISITSGRSMGCSNYPTSAIIVDEIVDRGTPVIVGIGNTGRYNLPVESTCAYNAISVANVNIDREHHHTSIKGGELTNYILKPEISALGTNIAGASSGREYVVDSGTSFSTPIIAGIVALMLEKNPNLTPQEIDVSLMLGADAEFNFGTAKNYEDKSRTLYNKINESGLGIANAKKSLDAVDPQNNQIKVGEFGIGTGNIHGFRINANEGDTVKLFLNFPITPKTMDSGNILGPASTAYLISSTAPISEQIADFDLEVRKPDGTKITSDADTLTTEFIVFQATQTGNYYINITVDELFLSDGFTIPFALGSTHAIQTPPYPVEPDNPPEPIDNPPEPIDNPPEPDDDPPVLKQMGNVKFRQDVQRTFPISATDENDDPISLSITPTLPDFIDFTDNGDGTGTFTMNRNSVPSVTHVTVRATSNGLFDDMHFYITVVERSDSDPPRLVRDPPPVREEATAPLTSVTLTPPEFEDAIDPNPVIEHDAGTLEFPVGTTSVTWTATDSSGNFERAFQSVTITDETSPIIQNVPADIITTTESSSGIIVDYTLPTATDLADEDVSVISSHESGSLFPVGTTTIIFDATDDSGNSAESQTFTITVNLEIDDMPPNLTLPEDKAFEATGPLTVLTTQQIGTASATDNRDAEPTITHNATDIYRLGNTVINYTATDESGNSVSNLQTITIIDTTAPVLSGNFTLILLEALTDEGITITFDYPTATDIADQDVTITSTHNSGDLFPVGDTTITFTATDDSGNSDSRTKLITVTEPSTIQNLEVYSKPAQYYFFWDDTHYSYEARLYVDGLLTRIITADGITFQDKQQYVARNVSCVVTGCNTIAYLNDGTVTHVTSDIRGDNWKLVVIPNGNQTQSASIGPGPEPLIENLNPVTLPTEQLSGFSVITGSNSFVLSWDDYPGDNNHYKITVNEAGKQTDRSSKYYDRTSNSYIQKRLAPSTEYTVTVIPDTLKENSATIDVLTLETQSDDDTIQNLEWYSRSVQDFFYWDHTHHFYEVRLYVDGLLTRIITADGVTFPENVPPNDHCRLTGCNTIAYLDDGFVTHITGDIRGDDWKLVVIPNGDVTNSASIGPGPEPLTIENLNTITIPTEPLSGLSVTRGTDSAVISWDDYIGENNQYKVSVTPVGADVDLTLERYDKTSTSYTQTGLTPDTKYTVTVTPDTLKENSATINFWTLKR